MLLLYFIFPLGDKWESAYIQAMLANPEFYLSLIICLGFLGVLDYTIFFNKFQIDKDKYSLGNK